jgi:hypothetical protein
MHRTPVPFERSDVVVFVDRGRSRAFKCSKSPVQDAQRGVKKDGWMDGDQRQSPGEACDNTAGDRIRISLRPPQLL